MRLSRGAAGAGLVAVVLTAAVTGVPMVLAAQSAGPVLRVTPAVVKPTDHITLSAQGCPVPAEAFSEAFDTVVLDTNGRGRTLMIDQDVPPGRYEITLSCNGDASTASLVVAPPGPLVLPLGTIALARN
ncbi:hypothetical protein ACEZCY_38150 [Streptacidiphilus sp. N1-12]|uniref:Uncharacterized protein n=2 Tax=Streptacidiphilus alkalitolerans TaxID=3342712 RepID=A0ABV6VMN5_9ACTN